VFEGTYDEILKSTQSLTGQYLSGSLQIEVPKTRRKFRDFILIEGARENNLKHVDIKFPLGGFTVVTGVSGSGKTSLVKRILYPALQKSLGNYSGEKTGLFDQ